MQRHRTGRQLALLVMILALVSFSLTQLSRAQTEQGQGELDSTAVPQPEVTTPPITINLRQLFHDGGAIGYVIVGLSFAMMALIFEQLLTIRRAVIMPPGLAEETHRMITEGNLKGAEEACRNRPSFLGNVIEAGLTEAGLGYTAIEKAMEEAAALQAARLFRRIEYLSVISTVAPMLGLMGTVWGMILAFMEFERKANPQVSELAPGIYKALVTTLFGLIVAIPAISAFALFRNRIDELVAQGSLMAERVFADHRRAVARRRAEREGSEGTTTSATRAGDASRTSEGTHRSGTKKESSG